MPEPGSLQLRLRHSVWLAVAEFATVAGLFYADVHHHIFVSKTPYLFLLGFVAAAREAVERRWLLAAAELGESSAGRNCGWSRDGSVGAVYHATASRAMVGEDARLVRLRERGWKSEGIADLSGSHLDAGALWARRSTIVAT
jgi:hypothetical protein